MVQIDIDMPKQCGECPLCVDYDCIIHKRVTDEYYDTLEEQYAHCPLTIPPAQPEPRWIPCSERLPEKYGWYLVTFIPSGGTLWTCVLIARYGDLMGIAKPSFHVGTAGKNDFMNITEQVTAWMPLPEPWKGEKNG